MCFKKKTLSRTYINVCVCFPLERFIIYIRKVKRGTPKKLNYLFRFLNKAIEHNETKDKNLEK